VLGIRGTDTVFICSGESKHLLICDNPGTGSVAITEECSTLLLCARSSILDRQFGPRLRLSATFLDKRDAPSKFG
jgi:hypothetical protein